jgi:hypothetical protein
MTQHSADSATSSTSAPPFEQVLMTHHSADTATSPTSAPLREASVNQHCAFCVDASTSDVPLSRPEFIGRCESTSFSEFMKLCAL